MQENVIQLQAAAPASIESAQGTQTHGAWVPDEQGFYRYVTLPPAPVFHDDESAFSASEEEVLYNVHVPYNLPDSRSQALANSLLLLARQGWKHIAATGSTPVTLPKIKISLPDLKAQAKTVAPAKTNPIYNPPKNYNRLQRGPKPQFANPAPMRPLRSAEYEVAIDRVREVQSELRHSWKTFNALPSAPPVLKNSWNLPRIQPQPLATESKPQQPSVEKAARAGISQPRKPILESLSQPAAAEIEMGLNDIFPNKITGFFLSERDAIIQEPLGQKPAQPEPIQPESMLPVFIYPALSQAENTYCEEESDLPTFFELIEIPIIETPVAEAAIELAAELDTETETQQDQPETQPAFTVAENADGLIIAHAEFPSSVTATQAPVPAAEPYTLPEMRKNLNEQEVIFQFMLRNNKILSNSIGTLAERYFQRAEQEELNSFLY